MKITTQTTNGITTVKKGKKIICEFPEFAGKVWKSTVPGIHYLNTKIGSKNYLQVVHTLSGANVKNAIVVKNIKKAILHFDGILLNGKWDVSEENVKTEANFKVSRLLSDTIPE